MLQWVSDCVWDVDIWFPPDALKYNFTWKDLENRPGLDGYYPDVKDLHWSFLIGILLLGVRYVFESLIVVPVAIYWGIPVRPKKHVRENKVLEKEYISSKGKVDYTKTGILTKQTDLTQRQIEIWFRRRKQKDAPSQIQKVKECCWHLIFYGTAFIYGTNILWNKPWLWDTAHCWDGFPHENIVGIEEIACYKQFLLLLQCVLPFTMFVDQEVYWYYMIELAFYWSLVFTIFSDHKRKDFTEMIVHHVATIFLIYFSWVCNFVRIGTLVLLVHDASDPWLALAKLCKYFKWEKRTDGCFVIFTLTWIVSRLYFYPYYILYSTTFEPYHSLIYRTIFTHWFFNVLLYTLMVLHILWSYSIFKIVVNKIVSGQVEDVRSDEEEEEEEKQSDMELNGNHKVNGISNGVVRES